jgi:hypothetical protein
MSNRRQSLIEAAGIFALFVLQGAWPMPGVNEPYYLGKALHYWNPQWGAGDFFLESADAHKLFYFVFGWVTRWLSLPATAWVGRSVTWALLAWAWRRLSFRLTGQAWWGLLSAGLLLFLSPRFAMAGEWIIGGVEAKGFAYVLVLLALNALAAGQWNRLWILLGAATAMHSLVGGWSILAAGIAWLLLHGDRPRLRSMLPAMAGGLALAMAGLIPSFALSWGVEPAIAAEANRIYVYERLPHHLDPWQFQPAFMLRFGLLVVAWFIVARATAQADSSRRLRAIVNASLAIALAGLSIGLLELWQPAWAAGLLRFYWFRLSDAFVPIGVALCGTLWLARLAADRRRVARVATVAAGLLVAGHLAFCVAALGQPAPVMVDEFPYQEQWRDVCQWIARSTIPRNARFLTPRTAQTFKWQTGRAEVANWKDVPQDARSLVEWWRRMNTLYASGMLPPEEPWQQSLLENDAETLLEMGRRYQADYLVDFASQPLALELLYENDAYAVYRLGK